MMYDMTGHLLMSNVQESVQQIAAEGTYMIPLLVTIVEAEEEIGVRLYRMNPDGTGRELVYEYLLPEAVQEVWEYRPGYLALMPEISGDEIVVEVFTGEGSHPFYRMNLDGGNVQFLGEILG